MSLPRHQWIRLFRVQTKATRRLPFRALREPHHDHAHPPCLTFQALSSLTQSMDPPSLSDRPATRCPSRAMSALPGQAESAHPASLRQPRPAGLRHHSQTTHIPVRSVQHKHGILIRSKRDTYLVVPTDDKVSHHRRPRFCRVQRAARQTRKIPSGRAFSAATEKRQAATTRLMQPVIR